MTAELIVRDQDQTQKLIDMVLATCASANTRKMYSTYIRKFLQSGSPLTREGVALYILGLRTAGASSSALHITSSAVKKLAKEAEIRHLISFEDWAGINALSPGRKHNPRAGLWLTVAQAEALLSLPDRSTNRGKRDACILALLLGTGLRRAEMVSLTWDHYQSREDRMCLVDVMGKGDKPRTVPVPLWAQADVDAWRLVCEEKTQYTDRVALARQIQAAKKGRVVDRNRICGDIGYEGIHGLVAGYGAQLGLELAPHDLRRTLAQFMRRAGAPLEQVQLMLGHSSIQTTIIYLGSSLELAPGHAAVDLVALQIREWQGAAPEQMPKLAALSRRVHVPKPPPKPPEPGKWDLGRFAQELTEGRRTKGHPQDAREDRPDPIGAGFESEGDGGEIGIGSAEGKGKGGGSDAA